MFQIPSDFLQIFLAGFASVLKKKKPVEEKIEDPQHYSSPEEETKELLTSCIPQETFTNQVELSDLIRFLKEMKIILSKIPDIKKTLEKNGENGRPKLETLYPL
ncbi:hypothetical protein AVEN_228870-1 [Araneus ventricosus]|uniref:Uncharacterized protein n=1 Tax=Araneus ventricosus TaxID=182803 RepID=A0A4Y2SPM3_ARAVE|nr:hypothetical protein AVEN_228870-1 [Araneus ventricosus]